MVMGDESAEGPVITKIIQRGQLSPALNSGPTIPLTFLDIPWMFGSFVQKVVFYEFPLISDDHFTQTIIPAFKNSLSISLQKFYPLAGKIIVVPPLLGKVKPHIVYNEGDSVPFTVAESTADFYKLSSNDPQDVKLLHPLIPQLAPCHFSELDGTCTISPLFAIQVTLFPNCGMSLGFRYNHTVMDGMSFNHFVKSWASICRTGDVDVYPLPFLDRGIVEDPNDQATTFLNAWWDLASNHGSPRCCHADQRATFVFSGATITRLKSWITSQSNLLGLHPIVNISSFAAVCAFTWVCIVKSTSDHDQDDDDQLRYFAFVADYRSRLKNPLPETYFGNCLVVRHAAMEKRVLVGQHGTVLAANAIAQKVKQLAEGGNSGDHEISMSDTSSGTAHRFGVSLSVAGSPHQPVYDDTANFGWGRPIKHTVVHIDTSWSISLSESRDIIDKGGIEVGVALTKTSMDVFTALFRKLDSFSL